MQMSKYYESMETQKKQIKQEEARQQWQAAADQEVDGKGKSMLTENGNGEEDGSWVHEPSMADRQHQELLSVSRNIWKSSRRFDADASSNAKRSPFDLMVKENAL